MGAPAQTTTQGYRHAQNALSDTRVVVPMCRKTFWTKLLQIKKLVTILTYYEKLLPTLYQKAPKSVGSFWLVHFSFSYFTQKKICISWVRTRGYQTMRFVHVDTPARSSSESAHEMQTFFMQNIRKEKPTPDDTLHS